MDFLACGGLRHYDNEKLDYCFGTVLVDLPCALLDKL